MHTGPGEEDVVNDGRVTIVAEEMAKELKEADTGSSSIENTLQNMKREKLLLFLETFWNKAINLKFKWSLSSFYFSYL